MFNLKVDIFTDKKRVSFEGILLNWTEYLSRNMAMEHLVDKSLNLWAKTTRHNCLNEGFLLHNECKQKTWCRHRSKFIHSIQVCFYSSYWGKEGEKTSEDMFRCSCRLARWTSLCPGKGSRWWPPQLDHQAKCSAEPDISPDRWRGCCSSPQSGLLFQFEDAAIPGAHLRHDEVDPSTLE